MKEFKLTKGYSKGEYNKMDDDQQWIRISEGCPNKCPYCAESFENPEFKLFEIPEIVRNRVNILDMNLLCKPEALEIIRDLGRRRVNNKVIKYSLQCGIDYRFLTQELASALKQSRFIEIRLAWDHKYSDVIKIKEAVKKLIYAGYNPKNIQIFFICNWKIPFTECCDKLDSLKIWNVQVSDCWFDNQLSPNIKPIHWNIDEIKEFRRRCRDHNIMIRHHGVQPERLHKKFDGEGEQSRSCQFGDIVHWLARRAHNPENGRFDSSYRHLL